MKKDLLTSVLMILVSTVGLGILYPLAVWGVSQAIFSHQANGSLILKDGKPVGSCSAPLTSTTHTTACALGGNPRYTGNEFLSARFADFALYARALSEQEISAAVLAK